MNPPPPPKDDLQPWFCHAILIAIALLFLVRNVPWHLDNYDQAKQAFTSFEMVQEGHWWLQHTPAGNLATKPPLAGAISSGLYFLMGGHGWPIAWRLPSFASAVLILVLLWRSGNAIFGNNIGGLFAAGAFGLNVFTPCIATLVRTDMLLTACIFLAGWLILKKVRLREEWRPRDRWMLFAIILVSMMTKGPIAFAFLLPGLVAFSLLTWRFDLKNDAWSGWWCWLVPLLFFAAWAVVGWKMDRDFLDQVVLKEFIGRFSVGEHAAHQPRNPFFYIGLIALRWTPWSLLVFALLTVKRVRAAFREDPALLWLACWSIGGLLFMSAVPSKRFDRILPVIPPLALMLVAMARHLPGYEWRRQPVARLVLGSVLVAFVISASYAGYDIAQNFRTHQGALVDFGDRVLAATGGRQDRLAVVSGKDEGMLLYTRETRFVGIKNAVKEWRAGRIDWLVLPQDRLIENKGALQPFERLGESGFVPEKNSAYILIGRKSGH